MPSKSNIDSFIDFSSQLLEAYPSTTTLSITYANALKKQSKNKDKDGSKIDTSSDNNNKKATNLVTFKCYEPNSGKCIKYSTYKIKELSRLLTFIGPRGVSVSNTKKRPIEDEQGNTDAKKTKVETINEHTNGLASIMSNVKFDNEEPLSTTISKVDTPPAEEKEAVHVNNEPATSSSKNKKKKKKGKK